MDDETIDDDDLEVRLAKRLGVEGVADELRSLYDKTGRLALMIHEKLPTFTGVRVDPRASAGVGVVWLDDDVCVTVFAPRVIEVFHDVKVEMDAPYTNARCPLMFVLASRELERVLAPVDRLNDEIFMVEFEGETFVVEVWLKPDEADDDFIDEVIADIYGGYDADWIDFCELGPLLRAPRRLNTSAEA
jgi:hypothetical protein